MFVIERNENYILQSDGSWSWLGLSNPKLFKSIESAEKWIERKSLPQEFVSISFLLNLLATSQKRFKKLAKKDKARLRRSKYLELPTPVEFFKSGGSEDDVCIFERFTATHTLLDDGAVIGVFGSTSCDGLPFYCYSDEEYHSAFQHYTRQESAETNLQNQKQFSN